MYRQKMVPDVSRNVGKVRKTELRRRDSRYALLLLEVRPQRDTLDVFVEGEPLLGVLYERVRQALKKA